MPQSLSRILLHVIFSTKDREPWLTPQIRDRAFAYLSEVGRDVGCEVYRVGGVADHVHLAIQQSRTVTVADFVQKVKQTSSVWIKEHGEHCAGFAWQAGYGAFSLGASQLQGLTDYIDRQEKHHEKRGFKDEYREFLKKYQIDYDEKYVWD